MFQHHGYAEPPYINVARKSYDANGNQNGKFEYYPRLRFSLLGMLLPSLVFGLLDDPAARTVGLLQGILGHEFRLEQTQI